jgi:hypothetical protein
MSNAVYENPEAVPTASQLAVLPFLAGIYGLLRENGDVPGLRITMHRAMTRQGDGYLQQLCGYVSDTGADWRGKVGRTFPVNEGIMGAAFGDGRIWRTKSFPTEQAVRSLMMEDMKRTDGRRDPATTEISYLAVPFLGPDREPVLILYATCNELNFFADDTRIRRVAAMGKGFCRLFDGLQNDPLPNVRNFPLQRGKHVTGARTLYASIQEPVSIEPPQFGFVASFNFETSVA